MADVLRLPKKLACSAALVEGFRIRSIERMTGVHRDTITRLLRLGRTPAAAMTNARATSPSRDSAGGHSARGCASSFVQEFRERKAK